MQLTGRWNYQRFADYVADQDIMANPGRVSDTGAPALGIRAAAWFWKLGNDVGTDLGETVNGYQGRTARDLTLEVSGIINRGLSGLTSPAQINGFDDRLKTYYRARSVLLIPPQD